jgi:ABC-type polysaccharide/polyol phosphate transport system ATPase subunit
MSDVVVTFDRVWKKFRRGERHDSLRDLVPSIARRLMKTTRPAELESDQEFWAVKDVSFEVKRGEALGIIGPNGAGKSTTLKLLTRILRPTRGVSMVRGRVGALIEVAAGFHPDLTGRENVYLQGAIMGMKRPEIARKLDTIVEFAGIGEFIDTPVKRYSSGMNARLGFSIAAHLEPDVLIIDEVLSVGDMAFQRRCIERMEEFRRSGVAIAFVSHDMAAVSRLCANAMCLRRGVVASGPTSDVIRKYAAAGQSSVNDSSYVVIESTELVTDLPVQSVNPGAELTLRVRYQALTALHDVTFGLVLRRTSDLLVVYDGNFSAKELDVGGLGPGDRFTIDYRFRAHVVRGQYHFQTHVYHNPTQKVLASVEPAGAFAVQETRTFQGVADLEASTAVVLEDTRAVANQ